MEVTTRGFVFKETESEQKCPDCGRNIIIATVFGSPYRKLCVCEEAKLQQIKQRDTLKGIDLYREQMRENSGLDGIWLERSLETFRPRTGQKEAADAARDFILRHINKYKIQETDERGKETNSFNFKGLLVIGSTGCGKTHLAVAIANAIIRDADISDEDAEKAGRLGITQYTANPVKFTNVVTLLQTVKASFSRNDISSEEIIRPFQTTGVLILDDLGAEKTSEWTQERIYEIVEYRNNHKKPMIITSNLKPADLQTWLGDRTYDRVRETCKLVIITAGGQRVTA